MGRARRLAGAVVLAAGLVAGGLALVAAGGCEVSEDEFYKRDVDWNVGRQQNPHKKYAFAYVGLVLLGTFFMWTVCKSSKRSVVKAGQEH